MTFIRLGKERESLVMRSEHYKEYIESYLKSRGYSKDTDSAIEGLFEDQVYYCSDRKRVNVECKDSEIGIWRKDFLIPFSRYLILYSKLPSESRFQFSFFARKLKNSDEFKAIFNNLETEQLYKLKKKCIEALSNSQNNKVKAMAGEMESVSHDILRAFVYESEIIEADIDSLKKAVSMRFPDVGVSSSILDILPNQTVSERLIQTGKPYEVEEQLLSNLFPLMDYPKTIWAAYTNLRRKAEVFRKFDESPAPAFILKEGRLLSFQNLSEITNPFSELIDLDSVSKHSVQRWIGDENKKKWVLELMHAMIRNYAKALSLEFDGKTSRYFLSSKLGMDRTIKWKPSNRAATRHVVKFYRNEEGEINFAAHRSVQFKIETIANDFFLLIEPCWSFTKNGITPIRGKKMNVLSNHWRTREHNSSYLRDVFFWAYFLADWKDTIILQEDGCSIIIDTKPVNTSLSVGVENDSISIDRLLSKQKDEIEPILLFDSAEDDLFEKEEDFLLDSEIEEVHDVEEDSNE
jgi:hypothetical protein